jgi:hypothetical protein
MMAQTSDKVSSIAARYVNFRFPIRPVTMHEANKIESDVRAMAASLLRQDEVKGLRKLGRILGIGKTA